MRCNQIAISGTTLCKKCTKRYGAEGDRPYEARCDYFFVRGPARGEQCPRRVVPGTHLCFGCSVLASKVLNLSNQERESEWKNIKHPTQYALNLKGVRNLSSLRENQTLTDATLIVGEISLPVHKLILVMTSPYFERLFLSDFKKIGDLIEIKGISGKTLQHYIDLIYGKEITVTHWREAFDLFDYLVGT